MADKVGTRTIAKPKFAASKIKAVAEQSWWRKTSKRQLAVDHNLTEAQIDELRATPDYQKAVDSLMLGQRSVEEFESGSDGITTSITTTCPVCSVSVWGLIQRSFLAWLSGCVRRMPI